MHKTKQSTVELTGSLLQFVCVLLLIQTGFSIDLKQLDGEDFTVKIDDTVECDQVVRVPGKGMPRRSGRGYGDLYITFEVDFPDKLSAEQKTQLRKILGSTSSNSEAEL